MAAGVRYEDATAPACMRLYAIGDVALIEGEILRDRPGEWRIVYLGDYVDRGPDSAGVIDMIARRVTADPRHVALLGNHDKVFAEFLADAATWRQFADFEGETTARSYGVELDYSGDAAIRRSRDALLAAVPREHLAFLNGLEPSATFGDFFFCHAGIRPGVPLDAQDPHDLIWIRRAFHDHSGLHPRLIVHGHTPHHEPEIRVNRVNLDTYAFASGWLTALAIEGRVKRFLEVVG
jgi:serine/threonine protein phosphatase 1